MIPANPQHIKKLSNGSEEQDRNNRANPIDVLGEMPGGKSQI